MLKKLRSAKKRHPRRIEYFILFFILLLAAYLRFTKLNWDQNSNYHPDERNLAAAVSRLDWPVKNNPEFYAYNGLPIFIIEITSEVVAEINKDPDWLTDWGKINLIARSYSAFYSWLSVLVFYLLAKKIFKKNQTVLLSSLLFATTVGLIQYAHYGVTESLLVLEVLALSLFSVRFMEKKKIYDLISSAIILGLSLGTKTSAITFAIIPGLAILLSSGSFLKVYYRSLLLLILAGLIFYLSSPNTFLHLNKFLESMRYEGGVVRGTLRVPYTMQFTDTPIYLFQLKNLLWQSSPLVMALFAVGIFVFGKNFKQHKLLWPLLLFSLLYFLYVGSWFTKFIRYMLPIVPAIILLAGLAFETLKNKKWRSVLLLFLVLSNLFWAFAYLQVFQKTSSRIVASDWIYQTIPNGSTLLTEHWDDGLPSKGRPDIHYNQLKLDLYDEDSSQKVKKLAETLTAGDYLFITSKRLYKSIPRNPNYPLTTEYYRLLFAGELGYQKIAEFSSYPQLLGITIKDDAAEETFQVYDHPVIMIFENTSHYPSTYLFNKIVGIDTGLF